ncbi:MAG: FemAB family PEP-CTERM system-associated protein [Alphaproteobacteria bacterium]
MSGPMAPVVVKALDAHARAAWDDYVVQHPQASFCHRAGWAGLIERSFGLATHYAYAERDGRVCGVLPLAHVKSRLFNANGLISTPFCVYGGPVADDEPARRALDDHALALRDRLGADFVEFREIERQRPDWAVKDDLYVTFAKDISASPAANLLAVPEAQRQVIRRAVKDLKLGAILDDDLDRHFHVYSTSLRDHGTPAFPRGYFRDLKATFGDDCELLTVLDGAGAPLATVMSFVHRDTIAPYYAGGMAAARETGAQSYMYWRLIGRAAERGLSRFDFGRSKRGTGSFDFKVNWGFAPRPLRYEFNLRPGREVPDNNPNNPKYRLFIAAWQRLPVAVANAVGPHLVRSLG